MEAPTRPGTVLSGDRGQRADRILSAGTVVLLVLLSGGGASTHPSGVLLGVPSLGALAAALMMGAFVWWSGASGLGGFLLPALAVLAAAVFPSIPSLLLFSGRPLAAIALAALVLAVVVRGIRPPRAALVPVFFVIYAAVAFNVRTRVGPDGDEPQYLMVAESLVRDHDLALDQDFKEERYRAFFSRPLEPHFRIRGPQGQIYSLHAVGLSILILPAYWLAGYAGASCFMALLAALLVRELRRLVRALFGDDALAEGTAWILGLSPPLIHFAGLIFTEIPAAFLVCVGLRTAVFGRKPASIASAALCAAALPWLNVRYSILSVAVVIALLTRLWSDSRSTGSVGAAVRLLRAPAGILSGSALALSLYHFELWGFFDPRRVYGRNREFSLDILPEGLPGLFLDQEFGLLVYAPIFILALAGVPPLWRRQRALAIAGLFAVCGVIATASVWPMWRGGFNPPARFLVPLISILAMGLAWVLRKGVRPPVALLLGWTLWCGLGGAMNIETVHRDRDGVAPFFRTQSGAREWTAALPSFVLSEDRPTRILALPWAALLLLTLISVGRHREKVLPPWRGRDTALASAVFMGTALFADFLSPRARAPERDATRLVGQKTILLPSLAVQTNTESLWSLDLLYEPHRHPEGLTFARALTLSSGRYEITLNAVDGAGASQPVLVVTNRRTQQTSRQPMSSLVASFIVDAAGDFDLSLLGGSPCLLSSARLAVVR